MPLKVPPAVVKPTVARVETWNDRVLHKVLRTIDDAIDGLLRGGKAPRMNVEQVGQWAYELGHAASHGRPHALGGFVDPNLGERAPVIPGAALLQILERFRAEVATSGIGASGVGQSENVKVVCGWLSERFDAALQSVRARPHEQGSLHAGVTGAVASNRPACGGGANGTAPEANGQHWELYFPMNGVKVEVSAQSVSLQAYFGTIEVTLGEDPHAFITRPRGARRLMTDPEMTAVRDAIFEHHRAEMRPDPGLNQLLIALRGIWRNQD